MNQRTMLKLHRWLGLVAGVMILIAAGTAIGLNHQDVFKTPPVINREVGPYAKYLLSVAADPADADRLLVGTADGIFRSSDGGRHWEEVVLPVPAEQVVALQFDPRRPRTVYAVFRSIGVFRSEDAGGIWEEVALPFNPVEGTQIAGLSFSEGGLVLATTAGIFRQADGAWQHVPRPDQLEQEKARGLVQLIYDLHDGHFWGQWGVPITDAVSVALILLVLTGYVLFFARELKLRAARRKARETPE